MSRVLLALLLLTVAPVQATTYTVMSNASSGPDTLRQALADADANPGPDTIVFDSSLIGATITVVPTLAVQSGEVTVSGALRNVTITGNSQVTIFTVSPGGHLEPL
jgi:hypothetical protein